MMNLLEISTIMTAGMFTSMDLTRILSSRDGRLHKWSKLRRHPIPWSNWHRTLKLKCESLICRLSSSYGKSLCNEIILSEVKFPKEDVVDKEGIFSNVNKLKAPVILSQFSVVIHKVKGNHIVKRNVHSTELQTSLVNYHPAARVWPHVFYFSRYTPGKIRSWFSFSISTKNSSGYKPGAIELPCNSIMMVPRICP